MRQASWTDACLIAIISMPYHFLNHIKKCVFTQNLG